MSLAEISFASNLKYVLAKIFIGTMLNNLSSLLDELNVVTIPILQKYKLRFKEVKIFDQDYMHVMWEAFANIRLQHSLNTSNNH